MRVREDKLGSELPEASPRGSAVRLSRIGFLLAAVVVASQRIAIPFGDGGMPITPLLLLFVLTAVARHVDIRVRPGTASIYSLYVAYALGLCLLVDGSWTSALLVALIWLPVVFTFRTGFAEAFCKGIVVVVAFACAFGVIQSVASAAVGWYPDPLQLLPAEFKVQGFNTTYAVVYGTHWMKANGFLFLEPAMLSLFSVIALVILTSGVVSFGKRGPLVASLLVLGMLSSVAVSGFVVLPALLIAILASRRRWYILTGVAVLLPLLLLLPQASAFFARAFSGDRGTSNDARLLRPYSELVPRVFGESPIFGLGPGSARRFVQATYDGWENEVTTPTVVKVLFEYGLVGGLLLALVLLLLLFGSRLPLSIRLALLLALTIPTDALTNASIAQSAILGLAAVSPVLQPAKRPPRGADLLLATSTQSLRPE